MIMNENTKKLGTVFQVTLTFTFYLNEYKMSVHIKEKISKQVYTTSTLLEGMTNMHNLLIVCKLTALK